MNCTGFSLRLHLAVFSVAAGLLGCGDSTALSDSTAASDTTSGWTPMFSGGSLDGWHVVGDTGRYYFEDDLVVAEIIPEGGSYLATDETYDNFEMVAEVKIDSLVNSGIQIRASTLQRDTTHSFLDGRMRRSDRTFKAGRATGYQIEVDPSERAWSGGLYEPSLRGWLVPLEGRDEARSAFKPDAWNTMRILAHGDTIRTWVNGISVVDTVDSEHATGWIGIQAHAANRPEQEGKKVWWRNVRIRPLD